MKIKTVWAQMPLSEKIMTVVMPVAFMTVFWAFWTMTPA